MESTIISYSNKKNIYLYDINLSLSILIHPKLEKVIKNRGLEESFDPYYFKKYQYLKSHGLFSDTNKIDFEDIEDVSIEDNIKNIEQIVFETTDHCNLNCTYCSLGDLYTFSKKERRNINKEYAITFLRYIFSIKKTGSELTIGFFGGEPLMNTDFIETIVNESKKMNIDKCLNLHFNLTTNATLIQKNLEFIINNDFQLLISLDGDCKAQGHRIFTHSNKNSFSKAIENIDYLYKKHPVFFDKNIRFNSVLHNLNSVKEIYEFIYNRYHKIPMIAQLNTDHVNSKNKENLDKMFHSRTQSDIEFTQSDSKLVPIMHQELLNFKKTKKFLANYSINFYLNNALNLLYENVSIIPTGTCSPFQRKIYMNTYNDLLPCEKVSYKHSLGKVNDKVIIDIDLISKKYQYYYNYFKRICANYYAGRHCSICIFTLDNLDKLGTHEFECPEFQKKEDLEKHIDNIFSFLEKYPFDYFNIIKSLII